MSSTEHVHGPDCQHDHHDHGHTPHVHGPHCNHGPQEPLRNPLKDIGRNDPCPCGSQKNTKSVTVLNMLMFSMVAGSIFILALAVYSIILWRRIWLQERQRQQQRQHQQTLQKQRLKDDLIVLTGSFLTEQMPWAEGCIRIKVILDHYDAELSMQPDNQVLHEVFAATENIPSHEAWRNLSSAEKKPYQQLLNELELQHKKASTQAIKQLQQQLQD